MSIVDSVTDAYFAWRAGSSSIEALLDLLDSAVACRQTTARDTDDFYERSFEADGLWLRRIACSARAAHHGLDAPERRRIHEAIDALPMCRLVEPPGYEFTLDWMLRHEDAWRRRLAPLPARRGVCVLEVGCFEGQTTCWLLDNMLGEDATITCVDRLEDGDPFFGEYSQRFYANIARTGKSDRVDVVAATSTAGLASVEYRTFDFVYLDANHTSIGVLAELSLAWPLVPPDGWLVLDDVDDRRFPGVRVALESFLRCVEDSASVEIEHGQAWITHT